MPSPRQLFVPGRIEVLGKHTDYAGGRSLLAAVERGFTVDVEPAADDRILIHDGRRQETVRLPVPADPEDESGGYLAPGEVATTDASTPGWEIYPRTVVRRAARDFPGHLRGCRIEISGTLPPAAGLSTSSALITATFLALDAVCGFSRSAPYREAIGRPPFGGSDVDPYDPQLRESREALAGYLGAVERGSPYPGLAGEPGGPRGGPGGVGTRGGSEDHVAILCAEPDTLVRYAFEPVRREGSVPLPDGHAFVVGVSGVVAEKKGGARQRYNLLSDTAARAADLWRQATGGAHRHLGAILEHVNDVDRVLSAIRDRAREDERDSLLRRARHFAAEATEIIPAAADAIGAGDLAAFGELVDRSQELAEELLGNQVPETVHLARTARGLGAVAASAFGAGFGGSVWALVPEPDIDGFIEDWRARYLEAFPDRAATATFFATSAAEPARTLG